MLEIRHAVTASKLDAPSRPTAIDIPAIGRESIFCARASIRSTVCAPTAGVIVTAPASAAESNGRTNVIG